MSLKDQQCLIHFVIKEREREFCSCHRRRRNEIVYLHHLRAHDETLWPHITSTWAVSIQQRLRGMYLLQAGSPVQRKESLNNLVYVVVYAFTIITICPQICLITIFNQPSLQNFQFWRNNSSWNPEMNVHLIPYFSLFILSSCFSFAQFEKQYLFRSYYYTIVDDWKQYHSKHADFIKVTLRDAGK